MTKGAQHWKWGQLFRCCHLCRKPPTSAGEESIPGWWMMTWLYLFLPLSLFIYHMLGHSLQCHQCRMWQCFLGTQITLSTPNLFSSSSGMRSWLQTLHMHSLCPWHQELREDPWQDCTSAHVADRCRISWSKEWPESHHSLLHVESRANLSIIS